MVGVWGQTLIFSLPPLHSFRSPPPLLLLLPPQGLPAWSPPASPSPTVSSVGPARPSRLSRTQLLTLPLLALYPPRPPRLAPGPRANWLLPVVLSARPTGHCADSVSVALHCWDVS